MFVGRCSGWFIFLECMSESKYVVGKYIYARWFILFAKVNQKKKWDEEKIKLYRLGFYFISIYLKYKIDTFNRYATDIGKNVVENV